MPTGVLTFKRQLVHDPPKWEDSKAQLTQLHVSSTGMIEDDGEGMLQVGGFIMSHWCMSMSIPFSHHGAGDDNVICFDNPKSCIMKVLTVFH